MFGWSGSGRSAMVRVIQRCSRGHVLVAVWQGGDGDQHAAQMLDGFAGG
jgi:hypothetical protein